MAVAALTVAGFVGCGGDDDAELARPGGEGAGDPSTSPSETAGEAAEAEHEAERPVTLPPDDVHPCELLKPSIRREFGLRWKRSSGPSVDDFGHPMCIVLAGPPGGYVVVASHTEGMERFEGIPEDMAAVRMLTIEGFRAAELKDQSFADGCLIGIDVADGQHLAIDTTDIPEDGTQDQVCEAGRKFSAAVLRELMASEQR